MKDRETIIDNYIEGYNHFNVEQMLKDLDPSVQFRNVFKEEVLLELNGIDAFKAQAESALDYFSERSQTINSTRHQAGAVEVEIAYKAIAAQDLPNGLKAGQELHLTGTSVFTFNDHNKITSITDIH